MKIKRPGEGNNPRPGPSRVAQQKAIEKGKIRAFQLECGHYTDYEIAEVYDTLRILGKIHFFCEKCEDWQQRKPKPDWPVLPAEPLF